MNQKQIKKVALVQGGPGAEREVSLMSAGAVAKAFDELNISYTIIDSDTDLAKNLADLKPDRVFLAGHGQYAEDGSFQGICEYLKIPYTGSGLLASSLCMDKCFFKDYIQKHGIPTPDHQNLNLENHPLQGIKPSLPFPVVVKPAREGSTLGISICKTKRNWKIALEKAFQHDKKILVESYIEGKELACSWFMGKALMPVEIIAKSGFYDYKSKYTAQATQYILPPRVDEKIIEQCKKRTQQVAQLLHIRSYCRADFILQNNNLPLMIEMNTLPGLTEHSLLPKSAQYEGIDFNTLILTILQSARLDYISS